MHYSLTKDDPPPSLEFLHSDLFPEVCPGQDGEALQVEGPEGNGHQHDTSPPHTPSIHSSSSSSSDASLGTSSSSSRDGPPLSLASSSGSATSSNMSHANEDSAGLGGELGNNQPSPLSPSTSSSTFRQDKQGNSTSVVT
ncbi:unnamed protein product [Linum trigynum]|uniref:Uncharacterized protein n=1 Tax=Linum trigynum TaxID=586398 RepID=A0AAV2D6Z7_9ROSI